MGRVKDILIDYEDAVRINEQLRKELHTLLREMPEIHLLRQRTEQLDAESASLRETIEAAKKLAEKHEP